MTMAVPPCGFRVSSAGRTINNGAAARPHYGPGGRSLAVQQVAIITRGMAQADRSGIGGRSRHSALLAAAAMALALAAVPRPAVAQPVVQALPDPAAGDLRDALLTLSSSPNSLDALLAAGRASITLGQFDSALDFYHRAEAVAPSDPRVKAGRATIALRQQQPVDALRLYAEAEAAGADMAPYAADRGLAFDLVGDNARAQQAYRQALALKDDPELSRRLALSQAIAGDRAGAEATLLPMLQRTDLASFRTRAFALAILGEEEEAVVIAETMLPANVSGRLAPYLRYMPRLTRAQQAAAANLGVFPPAGEVGRDSADIAALSAAAATQAPAAPAQGVDARLVPGGPALGVAASPPVAAERTPRRITVAVRRPSPLLLRPPAPPAYAPAPPAPTPEPTVVAALEPPQPSLSIAEQPGPAPAPQEPVRVDLARAFADFTATPAAPVRLVSGAVDLTSFEPVREVPAPPPPPPPPPPPEHPSRHWVQVATGRDTAAFAFDWRRIRRQADGLLNEAEPHVAAWGQTNRLLAGPFANAREANELVDKLKEGGVDSFRFTSSRGEEVSPLD